MLFAHGFGCDQNMWRFVAPSFEREFVTVLFDHVGAGHSDASTYSARAYADLSAYARDVVELGSELGFENAIFVGHSCGAMIGALASIQSPGMFERLVLVSPSPRYINDAGYLGGFDKNQVDAIVRALRDDYSGWAASMAPLFMGNPDRPALAQELLRSFQQTDPKIAAEFGHAIFTSDFRSELSRVTAPTLVLQCSGDPVVPISVGEYMVGQLLNGRLETMSVQGHFPHLASPETVISAIRRFISVNRVDNPKPSPASSKISPHWPMASVPIVAGGAPPGPPQRLSGSDYRTNLEALLFQRAGEFVSQCGRYDMYALAIEVWLSNYAGPRLAETTLTLGTRGGGILDSMKRRAMPPSIIANFESINSDLLDVIARHEIAARNYAVIPSLEFEARRGVTRAQRNPRDWYDYRGASDEELEFFVDAMERDILKVASLYIRLTDWTSLLKERPAV